MGDSGDEAVGQPIKATVKALICSKPFGNLVWNFFVREGKVARDGWFVFLVISGISLYVGYFVTSWYDQKAATDLKQRLDTAIRNSDKYEGQLKNAENALAPWKQLATSQYPNEPINKSLDLLRQNVEALKEAVEKNKTNPLEQPIASVQATIVVVIDSNRSEGGHYSDAGAAVGFMRSGQETMVAVAGDCYANSFENEPHKVRYRVTANVPSDQACIGRPISSLLENDSIVTLFNPNALPPNRTVLSGQVIWVINQTITLKFDIPAQTAKGTGFTITNLEAGFAPLRKLLKP